MGVKSFTSSANFQSATNQLTFCSPLTTTLNVSPTFPITTRTVNLTDPGATSDIVLTEGTDHEVLSIFTFDQFVFLIEKGKIKKFKADFKKISKMYNKKIYIPIRQMSVNIK